jgi:hypothetical protein
MLMDFQQEVFNITIAIGHPFESFYLVVDSLRNSHSYFTDKIVQYVMTFSEELLAQFHKNAGLLDWSAAIIQAFRFAQAVFRSPA